MAFAAILNFSRSVILGHSDHWVCKPSLVQIGTKVAEVQLFTNFPRWQPIAIFYLFFPILDYPQSPLDGLYFPC